MKKKFYYLIIILTALFSFNFLNKKAYAQEKSYKDFVVGDMYPTYKTKPLEVLNYERNNGTPEDYPTSTMFWEEHQIKKTEGWIWGSEKKNFPGVRLIAMRIGTVNAPYYDIPLGMLREGDTVKRTYSRTLYDSYENSAVYEVKLNHKMFTTSGASIDIFKIQYGTETGIEGSKEWSNTFLHSETETNIIEVDQKINSLGEYHVQSRALYGLYVVMGYKIYYETTEAYRERKGFATDIHYDVKEVKFEFRKYHYCLSYIRDQGTSLYKYKNLSDGSIVYDDFKLNDETIYI